MVSRIRQFLTAPERFFLVVALGAGVIFVVFVPPLQAPDELAHFFRIYQVSTGQAVSSTYKYEKTSTVGGPLPQSVKQFGYAMEIAGGRSLSFRWVLHSRHTPLRPHVMDTAQFAGSALYTPLPYIPQAIGIGAGRLLDAPPLILFYLGRLANLVAYTGLVYLAIRLIPVGKWGFVVITLLPTTLTQAASVSADTMTN